MSFDYRAGYDLIMDLQSELGRKDLSDYRVVKALAATYELQDYLTNAIAEAVAAGELEPDPEE